MALPITRILRNLAEKLIDFYENPSKKVLTKKQAEAEGRDVQRTYSEWLRRVAELGDNLLELPPNSIIVSPSTPDGDFQIIDNGTLGYVLTSNGTTTLPSFQTIPITPDHFLGVYVSLIALQTAHPTASPGDYAQIDPGSGTDVMNYLWDVDEGWVEGGGGSMVYPGAGIPVSTGSAWGTSIPNGADGKVLTMVAGVAAWADAPIGLPSMAGNGGKFLTTNGTVASWAAVSAAAAGSDTYVQFNDSGTFGGIGTFTYNKTTGELYFTKTGSANYIKFKPNSTGTAPEIELFYSGGTSRSLGINSLNTVTINGVFAAAGSVKGKGIVLGTNPTSTSGNVAYTNAPEGAIILAPTGASSYINYTNSGAFFSAAAGTLSTNGDFVYYRNPASITAFGGTEVYRIVRSTGNFLVGTSTDVASSIFTLGSITKGFLPPRMTTTQKNSITSPAAGLIVYDNVLNQMSYYNGTNWINF